MHDFTFFFFLIFKANQNHHNICVCIGGVFIPNHLHVILHARELQILHMLFWQVFAMALITIQTMCTYM